MRFIIAAMLVFFASVNAQAQFTTIDGTRFTNTIEIQKTRLDLKGAAMLRYLLFIDAYAGAFYLPYGIDGSQALDDVPKHLELEYRVSISADDLSEATTAKIKEAVGSGEFDRLWPKIDTLNRLYRDVKPGDRYALTYIPGVGTQLVYNSTLLGTLEGVDFARAMFGIWIGDTPINAGFRDRLLGKVK